MSIPRQLLRFGNALRRERDKIENRGVRMAHAALVKQYKSFSEKLALSFDTSHFESLVDSISKEEVEKFMVKYYGLFAPISLMYRKNAISQKSIATGMQYKQAEDNEYLAIFQQYIQVTLRGEAGEAIRTITSTSKDKIKGIIREILADSELQGQGIEVIKRKIMQSVGQNLRGNGWARARAIAQTEMIKASNQAANYAVSSTGFEYKKYWSSSHLPNVRPSHSEAEEDSIRRNGLRPDEFHSNGLRYVGDPMGSAEEVINCRCTELYEIV